MRVKSVKRYCKRGHDTSKCGRNSTGTCKECSKIHQRNRYWNHKQERNAESVSHVRLRKYGITVDQYNNLFDRQGGKCAICKIPSTKHSLSVDHCHVTGKVRGLLCHNCNLALGLLRDNTHTLKAGIEYLDTGI